MSSSSPNAASEPATTSVRYRCPGCHDASPVVTRCDRCGLEMRPDEGAIVSSVHGDTRSGIRPTGLRAVAVLLASTSIAAAALALASSELWFLAMLFASLCALSLVVGAIAVTAARVIGKAKVKRWPAGASPSAINDARDGEVTCIRGRVVATTDETIDVNGVRCVAVSNAARGGMVTRAVREFVVESASGARVIVNASELLVCGGDRQVCVPVGAEVEVVGVAHWSSRGEATSTFRSGTGLVLTARGDDPVRIRVSCPVNVPVPAPMPESHHASPTRVRVSSDDAAATEHEAVVDEPVRDDEGDSPASRRAQ